MHLTYLSWGNSLFNTDFLVSSLEILTQQVWDQTWESILLTNSQSVSHHVVSLGTLKDRLVLFILP